MVFDDYLLQLSCQIQQLAQLNEPSLATMGVITHLGGRTAHEDQDFAAAFTRACTFIPGLLTRVSHTGLVEASTLPASQPAAFVPLEHSAVDSGVAPDDLVLRRLPIRTLRDRPS